MKLTCKRDGLLAACQAAMAVVPSRTTMPVYQNFKLIATDKLTVMATDLEVGLRFDVLGVAVEEPGESLVPADRLVAILGKVDADEVNIESDGKKAYVSTFASEYEMPTEDPSAFSDVELPEADNWLTLQAGELRTAIKRTLFAAAKEEGRYAMRAVCWDVDKDGKLNLVATDGKRLAAHPLTVSGQADKQSALLPTKAMSLVDRLLADMDAGEPVSVRLGKQDAVFRTERTAVYARLVEGRFPPYRDVIPKKVNASVPLPVGGFLSAVRQAAVMTDDESKRIQFAFTADKVTLKAQGSSTGKSKVDYKLEGYQGGPLEISLDPAYVIDCFRAFDAADTLTANFVDGDKSAVFRKDGYVSLIVPLV